MSDRPDDPLDALPPLPVEAPPIGGPEAGDLPPEPPAVSFDLPPEPPAVPYDVVSPGPPPFDDRLVPLAALGEPPPAPALTVATRALILLGAEGLSVGFGVWCLRAGPKLLSYIASNTLAARGRTYVVADMVAGAIGMVLLGLLYVFLRFRGRRDKAQRLSDFAWRLAPLGVAGLVPLFLDWEYWTGRELTVLVLTLIFGLSLQTLVRASLRAPPLGLFTRFTARPRAAMARFLARHPRVVQRLPTALVLLGAAGYAAFFASVTLTNHWNLRTYAWDLGLEDNLIWNALHWSRPFFKSSPLGGPTSSHFGYHATFISYLLALPYALAPRADTLLVMQAVFMGAAAIPLFLFARRHVGPWAACLLSYVYLLYPPVHGSGLYDFHYLPVGVFFQWLMLYALDSRRNVLAVFAVLLTLAVREDVSAGVPIIGAYFLLSGKRPKAGLIVAIVGSVYFIVMKLIIMPRALQTSSFIWIYRDLIPQGEETFGGVLKTVIANPGYTLNTLLERDKLTYMLHLFVPLVFLPLRRPIGLLCCLPGFLFTLLATGYAPLIQTSFQYTANWTPYLFLAIVMNLAWVSRARTPDDTQAPARRKAWMVALAASTLICSYQFGAILQQHTVRGGFGLYNFKTTPEDLTRRAALKKMLAKVPKDAKICASELLVAQVSNRADAYTLRFGIYDAEYLLVWIPLTGGERTAVATVLRDNSFGVVDYFEGFVLMKRAYKTDRNAELLKQFE